MVSQTSSNAVQSETIEEVLTRAFTVAADDGFAIEATVREAAKIRLDSKSAERLYTRVLAIVKGLTHETSPSRREALAREIRSEVERLVAEVRRPNASGGIPLVERHGFVPRQVVPTPVFNGVAVPMMEGYVDVTSLNPWAENHRVTLYVAEFEEKNGRQPEPDELLRILTGEVVLGQEKGRDPFGLRPLADSIARKGVERPAIVTYEGVPFDGNRRIAASRLVLTSKGYSEEQRARARWIRVWRAPEGTTQDQIEAIVVAMNFEADLKEPWPEYVKAKIVVDAYRSRCEDEIRPPTVARKKEIKEAIARKFAVKATEVGRYLSMVQWADDFTEYHVTTGKSESTVKHRTDDVFQWFYEISASGPKGEKLTDLFDDDAELRAMTYDMMYDKTFDSGAQLRSLHAVAKEAEGRDEIIRAHKLRMTNKNEAQDILNGAISVARAQARARKNLGLDLLLTGLVKRLGETMPAAWTAFPSEFLTELRGALARTIGAIEGELKARSDPKGEA